MGKIFTKYMVSNGELVNSRVKIANIIPVKSTELSVQEFSENEYLLHQKKYGHYVKVSKHVYQLLDLIDGKKDFEVISIEYSLKYNQKITPELLYKLFFNDLSKYGLLLNTSEIAEYVKKPDYLKLSFTIIKEETLAKITPLCKRMFIPNLIGVVSIFSLVICLLTLWFNFQEIKDFFYMFVPTTVSLLYFFGIMFLSVTFHEFGHVSAAKFYGAKHGGIGGGFYLFTPVYYADVTDIWKLPVKQRIMVNLAGVYFELIFCSILCILSVIISNSYLGVMAFIVFVHSLYNLVPFVRNDGYWVLSDALNSPNLSKNSTKKLLQWTKSVFRLKKFQYSLKTNFLLLYGFINNFLIIFYVVSVLVYDSESILYFPWNIYEYVNNVFVSNFIISDLKQFVVPLVFYYLIFKLLKRVIKNFSLGYQKLKSSLPI